MKTSLLLAVLAALVVAALGTAGAAPAASTISFECTQPGSPAPAPFTCTQGPFSYECLSGTPAPGSFSCDSTIGKRTIVCSRPGLEPNALECLLGKNPNPFSCTFAPGTPTNQILCTKKP